MTALALDLRGVSRRFGDTVALDDATIQVRAGTVHALLGENGAGKTTLMRVAYGLVHPDAGVVAVHGDARRPRSPADAIARGIAMVQQHFAIVPAMTVAENVALGGTGRYSAREAAERVRAIGRSTGLVLDPLAIAGALSVGAQQRLEILKALARDATIVIFDEPTAVLAPSESAELLRWMRAFASAGNAIVLITHKLPEALAVADDVTVIRRGRTTLTRAAAGTTQRSLAAAMLGEGGEADDPELVAVERAPSARELRAAASPVVIRATGLRVHDDRGVERVHEASLVVARGEIVGIAAVEGSGQRELLRALAGRTAPSGGSLEIPPLVGFIPEDRHRDGLVLDFPLTENVALRGAGARRGLARWPAAERRTAALLQAFDVRATGPRATARSLSGGNQQKLVLARELDGAPDAIIAENPTRGLDLRASRQIRDRLRAARDAGTAIVLYSSDVDEVLALADRMLVVYDGRVRDAPLDREVVGRFMLGGV